jgi:hypothetical protein
VPSSRSMAVVVQQAGKSDGGVVAADDAGTVVWGGDSFGGDAVLEDRGPSTLAHIRMVLVVESPIPGSPGR